MREIKWNDEIFKVFDKSTNKMWDEKVSIVNGIDEMYCGDVNDLIFLQCSQAKDIHQSDIIEFYLHDEYSDDNITMEEEKTYIGIIVFSFGGWFVKTLHNDFLWFDRIIECSDIKVIGNIYEHPHLLEEA